MSKLPAFFAAIVLLVLGTAPGARAAIVTGNLSVSLGLFPQLSLVGSGTGTSAGVGGSASLSAGALSGAFSVPIVPPLSTLIDGFRIAAPGGLLSLPALNNALSFDGTTGTMGLNASAYLMMGATPAAEIPLAVVGAGGTQMFHVLTLVAGVANGNPYQLGVVTMMGNLNGASHTLTGTGVDNRTAAGNGTLVLVSPSVINLGALGSMASIATLTLTYVPEPGTLLLLGAGVAGLAAIGQGRRRVSSLRSLR